MMLGIASLTFAQWVPQATGFSDPSRGINHVSAVNENIVWAAAYDGSGTAAVIQEFTRTLDGGTNWTPGVVDSAAGLELAMIFALNADTAYAPLYQSSGSNPQGIYVTYDGGLDWHRQTSADYNLSGSFPNVVHFFNENDGFAQGDPVGGYFELYTTMDGGENWTRVPQANIPAPLSGEWGIVGYYDAVGDTIWWGTQKGRVFMSTDKGYTWTVSQTPLNTYTTVSMSSGMHGLAQDKGSGSTGTIYETFDAGTTWTLVNHTGNCFTNDIVHVPGTASTFVTTGAATGFSGSSYSYDGGHTWTDFAGTFGIQFLATDFVNPSTGWAGDFTDATTPSTVGGMYKFNGILTDVLNNLEKDRGVVAYPNPTSGMVTFALKGFENETVDLTIRDLSGRTIISTSENQSLVTFNMNVDLSNLPSGFYIAEVRSGDYTWAEKLVRK